MAATATPPAVLQLGTRVVVTAGAGYIRFVGQTSFAQGKWVGVELDAYEGKNDGSVAGRRYFTCEEGRGVFVRHTQVRLLVGEQDRAESPTPSRPQTRSSSRQSSLSASTARAGTSRPSAATSRPPSTTLSSATPSRRSSIRPPSPVKPSAPPGAAAGATRLGGMGRLPSSSSSVAPAARRPSSTASTAAAGTTSRPVSRPPSTTSGLMSPRAAIGRSQASQFAPARPPSAGTTGAGVTGLRATSPLKALRPSASSPVSSASARMTRGMSGASSSSAASSRGGVLSPPLRSTSALSAASSAGQGRGLGRPLGLGLTSAPTSSSAAMRRHGSTTSSSAASLRAGDELNEEDLPLDEQDEMDDSAAEGDLTAPFEQPSAGESSGPAAAAAALSSPFSLKEDKPQEAAVSKREHDELLSKLRILEARRAEDREKLRESDRLRDEAGEWEKVREKTKAKIVELSADVRELRKQNLALTHAKDESETQFADLQDQVELSLLDKEVAEEKLEASEAALAAEKERISELETELAVWREENARAEAAAAEGLAGGEGEDGEGSADPVRSALVFVQLEKQNLRLKDALIRLREITSETEAEHKRHIIELQKELDLSEDLQRELDNNAVALERAEAQVEDLKGQLDDALGAQDLLEQLTERNMDLSDKMDDLNAEIEDLVALKELADELEESHIETERQLQEELEYRDLVAREQQSQVERLEETVADYEGTIGQFRELVLSLQGDLEQVRVHQASQQSESESLASQSQAMVNLNLKLQASARKGQVKTVDLELRKLDAAQATDHLAMVKPYLLPAFFDEDAKAVEAVLFFARVAAKAELLSLVLSQQHDVTEALNSTVPEHLVLVCEARSKLSRFAALNKRFAAQLRRCPPQEFIRLGNIYGEVVPAERRLDAYVDSLRKEDLRAAECSKELDGFISLIEHLAEKNLAQGSELDLAERTAACIGGLDLDFDTIAAAVGFTKQALAIVSQDGDVEMRVGDGSMDDAVFRPLQNLVNMARNAKVVTKKLSRRADDLAAQGAALGSEYAQGFETLAFNSSTIATAAAKLAVDVGAYSSEVRNSKGAFELVRVMHIAAEIATNELGLKSPRPLDEMGTLLSQLVTDMGTALAAALDPDHALKLAFEPPWTARVALLHSTAASNLDASHQVTVLTSQLAQLSRDLRTKDESFQESAVKIELLERRMEQGRKQQEALLAAEAELSKSKKQAKDYEDAIEALQDTLDKMEAENNKLKAAAPQAAAPGPGASPALGPAANIAEGGVPTGAYEGSMETNYLLEQIESLRAAVRFLRSQSSYIQSQSLLSSLAALPTYTPLPPTPPASPPPSGLPTAAKLASFQKPRTEREAQREREQVWREVRQLAATPRLVDLAKVAKLKDSAGGVKVREWQRRAQGPEGQRERERERWKEMSAKVEKLVDLSGRRQQLA